GTGDHAGLAEAVAVAGRLLVRRPVARVDARAVRWARGAATDVMRTPSPTRPVVYVYPDIDAMSRAAARALIDRAREAVEAEGRCAIALSGGNTPRALYRLLATESARRMPWGQVDLFWGDERYVPADDPRSNCRMAKETLLDRIPFPPADRALRSGDLPGGRGAPGGRRRDLVGGRRRGDLPRPGGACRVSSILSLMAQAPTATAAEIIRRAHHIAVRDLRACYDPHGIVAGRLHFNAYWTRDGCWASWGALALGDADQVKALLEIFIQFQMPSGELPVRIEFLGHTFGPYHTRRMHPKALYRAGTIFAGPLDPTALFLLTARDYVLQTHDMEFCARFEPAMDRAVGWLMDQDRDGDGLIENRHFLADWMDSILKKDKDFYLNLLFYEGLRACQAVKEWLGHADEARRYEALVGKTGGALQRAFWNGR